MVKFKGWPWNFNASVKCSKVWFYLRGLGVSGCGMESVEKNNLKLSINNEAFSGCVCGGGG